MRNTMMGKILAGMTVVALVLVAQVASAGLALDIKLSSVGGTAIPETNSFNFDRSDPLHTLEVGEVLHFKMYLSASGNDANYTNDSVQALFAAFTSVGSTIKGNMANPVNGPEFSVINTVANGGVAKVQDLDADGDMDLGSTVGSSANNWFYAKSSVSLATPPAQLWGQFDFVVTELDAAAGSITITGTQRATSTGASWKMDGVSKTGLSNGATGTPVTQFGNVTLTYAPVTVPEPATMAILALGGLGMAVKGLRRRLA